MTTISRSASYEWQVVFNEEWLTVPAVYHVSVEEFEAGWNQYLVERYQ